MGLLDDLRRLFADAEVSLVGAREERAEAERALSDGDWFRARASARRVLDRAPRSPIGLALLADACEGAGLDAELEEALATLAKMAGASPDVWLRLGRVRVRVGAPAREVRDAFTRAVSWDDDPNPEIRHAARSARLALADLELVEGAPARAEGWLAPIDDTHADVSRRRLACAVARRARDDVARILPSFSPEISDAEGQRLIGEAESLVGNTNNAARALARAAILGDERAIDALRETIARSPGLDAATLRAVETVAKSHRLEAQPLWRAALASARGDTKAAAAALREALDAGVSLEGPSDRAAARALAVAARDATLLARCTRGVDGGDATAEIDAALIVADAASRSSDPAELARGLDALLRPTALGEDASRAAWGAELARALVSQMLPPKQPAAWDTLMSRLAAHARALSDLDALRRLEHLAAERARPVRVAIVGEFNAGKSTFVNALLGMDVAPTGILPTTAVAHVLRYGPDPIARARLRGGGARTVPPERLKTLLSELDPQNVEEVEVEVPFPYLQRVELVDTPGFNAPDPTHAKVAMDTLIEGAGVDVAIWLFDVGQALKTSERRVLDAIIARGIPLQALLNKSDRFTATELDKILSVFADDARSIGLSSWRPPLAFSARRAVEARISGDDEKLQTSGFTPVRALLEDELPAHGASLKERGLRRRAYDIAVELEGRAGLARQAAAAQREKSKADALVLLSQASLFERAIALDLARAEVDRLDAKPDACRRAVRDELRNAIDAFRRERDELLAKDDPSMAPYLERRLAEHVEAAAGRAMASALRQARDGAPTDAIALDEIVLDASAVSRGFAAGGPGVVDANVGGHVRGDVEGGVVRAVLSVLAARMRAHATRPVDDEGAGSSRARELGAMVDMLAPHGKKR